LKNYLARFFLVVLSWIACQQLHAQSVIQIEKRANQALAEKKFALAKVDFQTLVSREPESPTYNLNYAICLYNSDERNASKRYFEFALKYASTLCNAYFYLGKLNHLGYDFERAMVYYNQYLTCQKSDELNVKSEINFCVNGKELLKNPKKLKVLTSTNLPLASMLSKIDTESLGIGGGFFTDALLQTKQDKKKSYTPQLYFKRGNTFKVFSSYGEGQEFIGLYLQKRVTSDAWGKPTLIPIPQSGNWDLLYPYYHEASGYLYFSSNGFNSMGGKDFFRVKFNIETLECGSVENLGFPFSSSDDDLIFIPLNNDFSKSAFTSMRTTAPGKVSFFEAQFIPDLDPLVLIQGKLKDEVNQKNTQVTILVKDVNSGVEFGPFVSDQNGEYSLVLPGSGTYEFSATVNGSDQVFKNTQVIPSQAVNQVFTQDVNYSMKASQELAEFTYAFDQPINTDLLSLKHRALASMDQNLNSVKVQPNSTLTAKDNGSTKPSVPVEITEVFSQFGLTSDNLLENAKVLSDTLLAISDFGNVRSDQIELLQTLIQQNKAEQANLQSNNQSINLLLKEENDPIARKVLLDYQRELLDSLLNLENEVLVKNDFLDQLNSEKKDWEQQGLELKSNELSTKIAEALIKKDSVALLKLIADAKNDTERLLLITGNSKAEPNPLKELELMQSKLQSERSTLVKDFSSTQEQLQALKVDLQKAKKKDQEVIQGEINRLETRAKNLQLLIESKDEEILSHERTMQMALEKSLLEARLGLSMKENQKDIPYTESTIALNDQIRVNKNNQQSLVQLQASNKNSDPVRGLQAELKVLKLRMDAASQEQKARMAEDFQNLEAKIENLKSDAVSTNGGSSNNIAGQSSVTDNSTNLTQNSDNRGSNEGQENRTVENNSGQTNGTVNPDNRGTNEGQENRTAENNSGQTNGTVNPDNRGTNEGQENRTAENNSGQTNGTVIPDNRGTNEVQENRTLENNSGQTNGTVNPDNRGTNEVQENRTAENNSGQTNGTVNPDNRGTNEGQEIRTAENNSGQTNGTVIPDNRGTNEVQENRTAENNSGQTNGTVIPNNRGTNEVQENRTAENNSGQTNGTVNPDNRGTNEVQENRTAENNSGQTNGTVNPDNRGTNEGQVIRTAENNSGQTNGTVNPDNRGTNEGQEIRTAENRAEQTDGREKRNETVQKEEQLREVSQQVDQVLSVLEAETNTANSLEEQNNLDRIKSQLVQLNQTIELRQTMGESLYDKSFGVETLNRMIEETNQAIVSSGSGISSKVRPIQPLPSLDKSASSKTSDLLVFTKSTKPLTSQELETLSSQADYDQYLTLRKSISAQRRAKDSLALELQKTQILLYQNAKLDGVSSEFIERMRSIAEGMESLDQAIQRDFMELNTLSNNDQFANLVDQGILPAVNTNASSKKNYLQPIDVDFSLNANAKVQNNTYPILTQMPKGLFYRVQVGVFRNPVPDYFYREFTPVTGESLNNGLTAYLTGFFEGLNSARSVRDQIRGLGYKDAFIVAYCDGQRITNAQAAAYEKSGACSKRIKEDLLNEAFAILKETNQISQTPASKPKEVYFTVQVASLGSLDKGKLQGVPELMYTISPSGKYKYSSGKFDDLAIANARKKELRKQGYGDAYVVAYRDGIAVSYDEARIALSYMKETIAPTSPKNQDLAGVTYLPPPVKKYSLQKVESQIKRESIGKYNAMRSFVADSDNKVISCPVSFESISPFEWIYYADFAFDEVQNEYRVVVLSGNQSSSSVSIMHNVALHSNIPFEVKKKDNDGTELLFFTKNEEEIERLRNVANRLNLSLNVN
jgi:hypothetical protein